MENTEMLNDENVERIIQAAKLGSIDYIQDILNEQKIVALIEEAEACKTYITQQELHDRLKKV